MKKLIAYILISLHVFFTGNFGIVVHDYFSTVHALSDTWDFSNAADYTISNEDLASVRSGIGDLDLQLTQTGVISNNGSTVFIDRAWRFHALGNYAYVSAQTQDSIQVIDISDPTSLTAGTRLVNNNTTLMLNGPNDIVSNGNYLYVAELVGDAIQILDISDPANPVAAGNFPNDGTVFLNGPRGLDIQGDYLYVASANDDALQIFDISTPTTLTPVGNLDTANGRLNFARGIIVEGNYAYMSARNDNSFQVIDVSDPTAPNFVAELVNDGTTIFLDSVYGIAKSGDYIYATGYNQDRIQIIDVSDPLTPTAVGSLDNTDIPGLDGPRDVYVDGNYLVVANYIGDDVILLDITDPVNPVFESDLSNTDPGTNLNGPRDIQVIGDIIYISSHVDDDFVSIEKSYPTNSPTITANNAFNFGLENLTSFSETVGTNHAGTLTYQISKNNGTDWYYYDGVDWVLTTNGVSDSNSASVINTNINDFNSVGSGSEFLWRAYLTSNGDQAVEIDEINVTSAPPATPAPGGVDTNLAFWLKADKGTSTLVDGAPLGTWTDSSTNTLNATAVVAPIYRNNDSDNLNYNPVVDFNGSTQYLQNLANGAHSDTYYMVIVPDNDVEGTSSQGVPFGFNCESGTLSAGGPCGLPFAGLALGAFTVTIPDEVITHAIGSSANWRSSKTAIITYPAGKPMLIGVNDNNTASETQIYEKGERVDNATRNTYQTLSNADYTLGRAPDDNFPFYYNGKIAEVINYDGGLTTIQRQQIESYLAIKYGITLNSGTQNYVASDGTTTFWNTITNTGFNNNIFGIGRDDLQELGQVQSKSINDGGVVTVEAQGEGTNLVNAFSDISDREFFMSGDDAGGNSWTASNAPTGFNILSRKWKVQETGDVGNIQLTFDVDDTNFDIPSLSAGTNYFFVYDSDNDGDFSDETPSLMTNVGGSNWESSSLNIGNGQIYTIATTASLNNIPTDIDLSSLSADENVVNGTVLGSLSTTDADPADTHSYSFVSGAGDEDNNRFTLSSGNVVFDHSPDHEIQDSYNIRIETSDGNGGTYQESFTIIINDLGESITSTIDLEDSEDEEKYEVASGQWNNNTVNPNTGTNALESNNLGLNNTQSCFIVNHNSNTEGFIDFFYSVSSEAGSDVLRFFIDNVQLEEWSGTIPYTQYTSVAVPAGPHEYKWCYVKDNAGSAGTDNAYVDDINFINGASDTTAPTILSTSIASEALLPGGNHDIEINYQDLESGIDTGSAVFQLAKWDGVSSYGGNIAGTGITTNSVTSTGASFSTNDLEFGRYLYAFQISDNDGNTSTSTGSVFYIDTPEFIISTPEIDLGTLSSSSESFSPTVIVTVRTVGAEFDVTFDRSSVFTDGSELIPSFDGSRGYGYQQTPYTGIISPIAVNQSIASESRSINTNGLKNTYTYEIQIGALINTQQAAGEYVGNLDFDIQLEY